MNATDQVEKYFDRNSVPFDAIYTGDKGAVGRLWDRIARRNITYRLNRTIDAIYPVAGKRVLDVGCGPGRYAVRLVGCGAKEVVGLDISARMIELAASLAKQRSISARCKFLQMDVLKYSASEPYDVVVAQGFFDYVFHPQEVFAHLRSLCRGKLVASFPWRYALRTVPRKFWLAYRGCGVRFYTRREVLRLCQSANFRCKTLERSGPIHFLIAESGNFESD